MSSIVICTVEPLYNTIVFHQNTHKRYGVSFVSSKPDPYPTPVDVVVYLIAAIMNRVIKRFYCIICVCVCSNFKIHLSDRLWVSLLRYYPHDNSWPVEARIIKIGPKVENYPLYSISQEICTWFCCALLWCGYAIVHNEFTWSIDPYSAGLLCWHWGNR